MGRIAINGINYSRVSCEKLNEIITKKGKNIITATI